MRRPAWTMYRAMAWAGVAGSCHWHHSHKSCRQGEAHCLGIRRVIQVLSCLHTAPGRPGRARCPQSSGRHPASGTRHQNPHCAPLGSWFSGFVLRRWSNRFGATGARRDLAERLRRQHPAHGATVVRITSGDAGRSRRTLTGPRICAAMPGCRCWRTSHSSGVLMRVISACVHLTTEAMPDPALRPAPWCCGRA